MRPLQNVGLYEHADRPERLLPLLLSAGSIGKRRVQTNPIRVWYFGWTKFEKMMEQNERTICVLAVEKFGPESQINMAIEECAELINALCKLRRERVGTIDVVTEIADVQIMCEQLAYMFGDQTVADERKRKIERLQKRLTKYNGTDGK